MQASFIKDLSVALVERAKVAIEPHIVQTPLLSLRASDPASRVDCLRGKELSIKCETLQTTGSFKLRGAAFCLLENLEQAKSRGVIAASAGNHAQGVAAICNKLGVAATIVMPEATPLIKVAGTKRWDAKVELVGSYFDESFAHATSLADKSGALLIHAFADSRVMAGQGTIGLELLADPKFEDCEAVVIPVGGGGLATGIATVLREKRPGIRIYGCGALSAPAVWRSYHSGGAVEEPVKFTLAEGVATKKPNAEVVSRLRELLDDFWALSESSIAHSVALLAEQGKLVVEGAGALPLAAVLEGKVRENEVTLILSGGNIDATTLTQVLSRGLVEQERFVRLKLIIPDRPGGLHAITTVLSAVRANILQVAHQRNALHLAVGETEVEADIETRGAEHVHEILAKLKEAGIRAIRSF